MAYYYVKRWGHVRSGRRGEGKRDTTATSGRAAPARRRLARRRDVDEVVVLHGDAAGRAGERGQVRGPAADDDLEREQAAGEAQGRRLARTAAGTRASSICWVPDPDPTLVAARNARDAASAAAASASVRTPAGSMPPPLVTIASSASSAASRTVSAAKPTPPPKKAHQGVSLEGGIIPQKTFSTSSSRRKMQKIMKNLHSVGFSVL